MICGALITRNEEDIIEEVMDSHTQFCDYIYVIDDSSDNTAEIIQSYDEVVFFARNKDTFGRSEVDEAIPRGYLYEKIQGEYKEGWIVALCGDEIFFHDPLKVIDQAELEDKTIVRCRPLNFFFHRSEREAIYQEDPTKSIVTRRKFFAYGGLRELRMCKNLGRDPKVRSRGQIPEIFMKADGQAKEKFVFRLHPLFLHYNCRSPSQLEARIKDRIESGFGPGYGFFLDNGIFLGDDGFRWPGNLDKVGRFENGIFYPTEIEAGLEHLR